MENKYVVSTSIWIKHGLIYFIIFTLILEFQVDEYHEAKEKFFLLIRASHPVVCL